MGPVVSNEDMMPIGQLSIKFEHERGPNDVEESIFNKFDILDDESITTSDSIVFYAYIEAF